MIDYIELKTDDVIREGDECQSVTYEGDGWTKCVSGFGVPVRAFSYKYRFRRPSHVAIRDAAIEVLRGAYSDDEYIDARALEDLRQAIGFSVAELRGASSKS